MTRPKGAKNYPKDLSEELDKVKQLFTDRGVDFPLLDKPEPAKRKHRKKVSTDPVSFELAKEQDPASDTGFECGACHRSLDQEYAGCPYCGAELTWTE